MRKAIKELNRRATGIDGLSAEVFKREEHKELLSYKLADSFNKWFSKHSVPNYVKRGRLVNLSKENTA